MTNAPVVPISVPDRFESLRSVGDGVLKGIVMPIDDLLEIIDARFEDINSSGVGESSGKGSLMLLRGDSGAGKSTFLDTVGLFRSGVETVTIRSKENVQEVLAAMGASLGPRIIVLEGREALRDVSDRDLESALHEINSFTRSEEGKETLFVWPTNRDDLSERLADLGDKIGDSGLFGVDGPIVQFSGPPKEQWVRIAERTVSALNQGAQLSALGISAEKAEELLSGSSTVGHYLASVRKLLLTNTRRVKSLQKVKQERVWIVVIAGNDPDNDVAALTRGRGSYADIERSMSATEANVVAELKNYPDQLGILGTVLDARIMYVDTLTAQAVARQYGSTALHAAMRERSGSTAPDPKAPDRFRTSELGIVAGGGSLGVRRRGKKPGSSSQAAFAILADIAAKNDGLLNAAFAAAMTQLGLASNAETEVPLEGSGLKYHSDILATIGGEPVRIEMMWRKQTSRAEIANYALTKLNNYGKAIGLLVT
ncbi:hypothetical protein [Plantibacter sp. T3]|uniref:hypothetical protein n=1 Tax=Plantibacter sp. T3 TaxID=2653161 RepID=UPI0012F040A7|nr:hypothetical protein [Plantibacter sp. T3]VXB11471.1 conserved hypothetical protein [Plantibacter sp. T3]